MKYYVPTKLSENIHETPEGFLLCIGVPIGRVGEMLYARGETPLEVGPNGTVTISRTAEELFRDETIRSFEGKSLTIKHPEEFVAPENWQDLTRGILQNVHRGAGDGEDPDDLISDILITDHQAIALVKAGLREVSCGYEAEYVQTGPGQGEQRNIIGNHLALVEQGRAGASYAINDHKNGGKGARLIMKTTLKDKIKTMFGKAQDEALKLVDEAAETPAEKKDESKDAGAYDELTKLVKDLAGKVEALGKPKDEAAPKEEPKKEEPAKDEAEVAAATGEVAAAKTLEERLSALEAMVSKIMEGESEESEGEEFGDEEGEEADLAEDSDEEKDTAMTGDTAARAEILAPGIKASKDVKAQALKAAYKTAEGKKVIDMLSGGKPTFDSAEKVQALFVGASELLKASRTSDFSKTKTRDFNSVVSNSAGAMTPEKMNELNAARYGQK